MRTAITIQLKRGEKKFEILTGPEVPIRVQHEAFKKFRVSEASDTVAEVQFWESGGHTRVFKFITSKEKAERIEQQKKLEAEQKAKAEAEAKFNALPEAERNAIKVKQTEAQAKKDKEDAEKRAKAKAERRAKA